jgi:RHS repeat-associated protein
MKRYLSQSGAQFVVSAFTLLLILVSSLLLLPPNPAHAAKRTIHFYNDIAGTPQMAVDATSGQVLWKETYRPYGERINNSPASATGKGQNELYFHGKQAETLNNGVTIQYFGARYTMPGLTDRFTSVDPVHFQESSVHSFNRYAYGNNNPYRFVDPDGNAPVWAPMMIYFGGGAAAGAGGAAGISIASQYLMKGSVQWGGHGGVFDAMSEGAQIGLFLGPAAGGAAGATRAAASRNSPQTFKNIDPKSDIGNARAFAASDVQKSAYNGTLNYVVTESGALAIGRGGHTALANGGNVLAAGEAKFVNGGLRSINNASGHYRPSGASAQNAAETAFGRAGFEAAGKYVEKAF